jgi:hypothetical protein
MDGTLQIRVEGHTAPEVIVTMMLTRPGGPTPSPRPAASLPVKGVSLRNSHKALRQSSYMVSSSFARQHH